MVKLNKYTCGGLGKTDDVFFTGTLPSFLSIDSALDRRLTPILEGIGNTVQSIVTDIDISNLNTVCFSFDETVKNKELHQLEIDKICDHKTRIDDLTAGIDDIIIGNQLIEIDLDCLLPLEEGCEQNPKTYSLQTILELFISEVCILKDEIEGLCDSGNGTSGTSGII